MAKSRAAGLNDYPESISLPKPTDRGKSMLVLVVEYAEGTSINEVRETVDKAREYGSPRLANYYTLAPMVEDLT